MNDVAGVDGCRGGWVVAILHAFAGDGQSAGLRERAAAQAAAHSAVPPSPDLPDDDPWRHRGHDSGVGGDSDRRGQHTVTRDRPGQPTPGHDDSNRNTGGDDGDRHGDGQSTVLHDGAGQLTGTHDGAGQLTVAVVERIGPVVHDVGRGRLAAVAVDMPIGLPTSGPRACDLAARQRLGSRRSSVFPTPPRAVLGADDYGEALARARAATGRGLSRQAFHLLGKIAELDAVLRPALQDRVAEAHPELAFARLAGHPAVHPKRTASGRAERARLLRAAGLGDLAGLRLPGAAPDDVLDAVVLTLTAARVRDGTAERLGDGARDARDLRMEIVV